MAGLLASSVVATYAAAANANLRSSDDLLAEYRAVRSATMALVRSFDDSALERRGIADANPVTGQTGVYALASGEAWDPLQPRAVAFDFR